MLGVIQATGDVVGASGTYGGSDVASLPFAGLGTTRIGEDIAELMRLDRIPAEDVAEVFGELGGTAAMLGEPSSAESGRG